MTQTADIAEDDVHQSVVVQPHIPNFVVHFKLTKAEDFFRWKDQLFMALRLEGLERFVLEFVLEPDGVYEKSQWEFYRTAVDSLIQDTVADDIQRNCLERLGWDRREIDPKGKYDLLVRVFELGKPNDAIRLLNEFGTIRRASFEIALDYVRRINYIRDRLNGSGTFKMSDEAYLWMAIKGLQLDRKYLYLHFRVRMDEDELTWAEFTREMLEMDTDGGDE